MPPSGPLGWGEASHQWVRGGYLGGARERLSWCGQTSGRAGSKQLNQEELDTDEKAGDLPSVLRAHPAATKQKWWLPS